MKRQPRILAGTALGLLMASAPLGAFPLLKGAATDLPPRALLAQTACQEGETAEACAARQAAEQEAPAEA
ncbi:MAG: hypothetical protein H0T56_05090, partial [Pseudaminobacter sp.]|nr:hypothetical protein [Pseudaminobacter sp.]